MVVGFLLLFCLPTFAIAFSAFVLIFLIEVGTYLEVRRQKAVWRI